MTRYLAALATAAALLAPAAASAEYLCEKLWNQKHGAVCPAGSHWDATSAACIVNG
ncbi:hypothetical protein P1J78_14960 [Psychromarinibacter sp. C21-152]|uniref:Chitin binding Peritrophin-A domain-containing protein n=1 Tax=Psychromarinibacter sediminicola TaxID=3033385 RepID=A0AAE3NW59_9RHOB|nr:hypothetical protein [Psychromarinibacter sediminicola]MDF0602040.1 hypothetical protein [Psychromarinibacter sediminicola]